MGKAVLQSSLNFVFTPNRFIMDATENEPVEKALVWKERFEADRYSALYQLGFSEKEEWFTPTMLFLHRIPEVFIRNLTRLPELELVRDKAKVSADTDLWSLFDFMNRGLLGTAKEFSEFVNRLADDPSGYGRLRVMVSPFILRRLKADKEVITDLPEKTPRS